MANNHPPTRTAHSVGAPAISGGDPSDPLHQRVRDTIAEGIAAGKYHAGAKLPSERKLSEELKVSRLTLRRALKSLVDDGIIRAHASRGWFVSAGPIGEPANVLMSFSDLAKERGFNAGSKVLHQTVRPASLDEAEALAIAPGSDLLDLRRTRLLDDMAIAIDHSRVPVTVAPSVVDFDFDLDNASLYAILRQAGAEPVHCTATVEAVPADAEQAGLLYVEVGAPLLHFSQITMDRTGRPVDLNDVHYRGDRYRFRTHLLART